MKLRHALLVLAVAGLAVIGLAAPASAKAKSGTEHILALSNSSSSKRYTVIGIGPIHARGVDIQLSATKDRFKFPDGALLVKHNPKHDHNMSDPKTCLQTYTESGTYTVTGGTGAYKTATGHGKYSLSIIAVGCSQSRPPKPFQLQLRASGPLTK
ncbi:MAG TPA: hypothetical protein VFE19_03735 [Jatrophihabitantaceae bacterium]|nr:hypothetical protein [Jatrophihabitantaceae bacterium]